MFIKLKVHAAAKKTAVDKRGEDSFEIWVRAPAEEGRANKAALYLLAAALKQDVRRLHIVKGATSPNKIVSLYQKTHSLEVLLSRDKKAPQKIT